jgi:hypothetical protein
MMSRLLAGYSVDENRHVLAKPSLVVKDVAARSRVGGEVCLEDVADVRTVDDPRRALHMALNVVRESDGRHS